MNARLFCAFVCVECHPETPNETRQVKNAHEDKVADPELSYLPVVLYIDHEVGLPFAAVDSGSVWSNVI